MLFRSLCYYIALR